jgi:hypothetical protein
MTSFSLVAPFLPTQCGVLDPRLAQLPEVTGGVREELCSPNWSSVLDTWSRSHFGYRLWFQLPASPTIRSAQTLEVSVNGVALPAQSDRGARLWRYDDATGAIIFELLSVPEPGQTLRDVGDVRRALTPRARSRPSARRLENRLVHGSVARVGRWKDCR